MNRLTSEGGFVRVGGGRGGPACNIVGRLLSHGSLVLSIMWVDIIIYVRVGLSLCT